ncbi:hypothetical protein CLM85_00820 [Streptomyces albidoflavus]|uniref:DUF6233 domain-containing protein n=1 Tax=Streptomyces albidoflavus TaxID=1886 RepID=UPI000BAE4D44|nr:DUF6233 domain-containing protein [Streptomyces albidoflavus]PAX83115.1 hypothetical protein CLM81_23990 [Streptomyces albidoflavus]PBO17434.1 hypothetical protein CLM83_18100 [Streptomyces albidoflavus]PBO26098.1 hypothetical protein CLM85_00820 [Streptomyces albidoflavus]PBO28181.1 hypothetical protein CLM84_21540 [Streptomyces albidoflavus]
MIDEGSAAEPSRLAMLQFAERVAEQHLAMVRRWRQREEQLQQERAASAARRPPLPDFVVELGIGHGAPPVGVHLGDCHAIGSRRRSLERARLLAALAEGVEACTHCRPDKAVGYLD